MMATPGRAMTSSATRKTQTASWDSIRIAGSIAWAMTVPTSERTLAPSLALWWSRNQV